MKAELRTVQPRRILVRGVNWLGDAVMSTPGLQRLRERFPEAHITLLTQEKVAPLWQEHPSLNRVLSFTADESAWSVARRLRAEAFDLVVVLPNSPRSALESWLAHIPLRVGYTRPWRNWFLTHPIATRPGHVAMPKRTVGEVQRLVQNSRSQPALSAGISSAGQEGVRHEAAASLSPTAHQVHEYLHLAAALGASAKLLAPHLAVTPAEVAAARARFKLPQEAATPVFGLNAGAEYGPAKRWPLERFIAAAQAIHQRTGCLWLLFGGPGDAPAASAIHSALRTPHSALVLAGQTSLRELMALLKCCRLLLTNDTGPMHVAAALGTPVVVPFGSTSPELTGPGLPGDPRHCLLRSPVPCAPCFLRHCPIDFRCMNSIPVERVVQAVTELSQQPL